MNTFYGGLIRQVFRWGIEEEVFLLEGDKPAGDALYPLYRLVRKNPGFFFFHTASNAARGRDLKHGKIASIEISTSTNSSYREALFELALLRQQLAENCNLSIIATGMLPHLSSAESIVTGLHVHVSGFKDAERAIETAYYFAPALFLLTANSPSLEDESIISVRLLRDPYIGPRNTDPAYRFQDIIISRRLNTLEFRLFDPCPSLQRINLLLRAIEAVIEVSAEASFSLEPSIYAELRNRVARGMLDDPRLTEIINHLSGISGISKELFYEPPALKVIKLLKTKGLKKTLEILDAEYRLNTYPDDRFPPRPVRYLAGYLGYYLPRLPYVTYKFLKEHGYL